MSDPLLADAASEYRSLRAMADKALSQVGDDALHARLDPESNSLAVVVQHLTGNLRSRWRDVLTTDGEKPDRDRDAEFEDERPARDALLASWSAAWDVVFASLEALTTEDLDRTVTIRGQAHTVRRALVRNLGHTSQHVGQIVMLAKHLAGPGWKTLSIPRGASRGFEPKAP